MSTQTPSLKSFPFLQQISLRALAEDVRKKSEEYERGVYDENVRTVPRWQAQEMVPSNRLRPGSTKQILRAEEEEQLELVCHITNITHYYNIKLI